MAATATKTYDQIQVSGIDADWTSPTYLNVVSVKFVPAAANDKVVIKNVTDAGPVFYQALSTDGEPRIEYFQGRRTKPMIDFSISVLTAGALVIFTIQ